MASRSAAAAAVPTASSNTDVSVRPPDVSIVQRLRSAAELNNIDDLNRLYRESVDFNIALPNDSEWSTDTNALSIAVADCDSFEVSIGMNHPPSLMPLCCVQLNIISCLVFSISIPFFFVWF